MTEVRIVEAYYDEFHKRKDVYFDATEAVEVYKATQLLLQNWPQCATNPNTEPEVGKRGQLYYLKFNFNSAGKAKFRICFGVWTNVTTKNVEIVALTCRTKQELSGGSTTGTRAWNAHMDTVGKSRWDDYRRGLLTNWKIY